MTSSSSFSRDDQMVGTLHRRPARRVSALDDRPASKRDAVLLGTTSLCGDSAYDAGGKFLGEVRKLVLDIHAGRIAYVLLSVGGFLGIGSKIVALPWSIVAVDRIYQRCVINTDLERLIDAPSLDGDFLPRMADPSWATEVHAYFGCRPYWK